MEHRALWYRNFGPPQDCLSLESAPLGSRPEGTLRIEMRLAPVNPSDLIPITGAYRHRVQPPQVAGYEGVGHVTDAPAAYQHLIGRRVLSLRGNGTWQTHIDAAPALAIPVPDDIPDVLAARAYINPLAAHLMLKTWPVKDRHVLLTGAGSTCASLLAQWAWRDGARSVTGVYRSDSRKAELEAMGVEPVSLVDTSRVRTVAEKADLTLDALGGETGSIILNAMPAGGAFVSYGLLSGKPVMAEAHARETHTRFHMRESLGLIAPQIWQTLFQNLWPMLREAKMPDTDIYTLEDWQSALAAYARPGSRKPLLDLQA
ncbi:zinc-dependent alcohol dehydrogenase family protein [Hyphomonas pacifica]|uniref:Alcohol dehydrogenase-like N-terminal domain-containing protein n=1 Tax=Hyphomonas pacifica TaxID=1280941 RepID=A0A062U897_9PROT|nr:zinc-dependent alcohol dehydrogenase family protein [Hyphomonas pacifica]KCZ52839.1 hypothetical protein HY2_06835 [Hyphomonas pacifica]RAN35303.1 hypothetical protein HY3_08365 [Hyphomonas pacifica]